LQDTGAAAVLATCTQLLSALLGNKQSVEWFKPLGEEKVELSLVGKDGEPIVESAPVAPGVPKQSNRKAAAASLAQSSFFDALVTQIRTALDQPALQPSALQLLRRVLLRNRVLTAAVYQCIDAVGEVLITAQEKRLANQCAQIYVDFMLDYPHEQKAIQERIAHLVRNLGYVEEGGRRAVLNCLYLVVLHFPEAELANQWSGLIFVSAAARLPQETDPTAHQMLHVLIKSLLERVGTEQCRKLLDLALSWHRSPKRILHAALAEVLGLFAEGQRTNTSQLYALALPALAAVLKNAVNAEAISNSAPAWRTVYAVGRSFEKMLAAAPLDYLEQLLATKPSPAALTQPAEPLQTAPTPVAEESLAKKRKSKDGSEKETPSKDAAPAVVQQVLPSAPEALAQLWSHFMGGQEAFTSEDCHPWVLAVSLRTLEAHLARLTPATGRAAQAGLWFNGGRASAMAVTGPNLLRALEGLISGDRMEREPTNAPISVRALCSMTRLLLLKPELMPEGSWEEEAEAGPATLADSGEMGDDAESSSGSEDEEAVEKGQDEAMPKKEQDRTTEEAPKDEKAAASQPEAKSDEAKPTGDADKDSKDKTTEEAPKDDKAADEAKPAGDADEVSKELSTVDKDEAKALIKEEEEEDAENIEEESDEEEEEQAAAAAAGAEAEGGRKMGESLFETVDGRGVGETQSSSDAPLSIRGGPATLTLSMPDSTLSKPDILRRSRVRWLVVRLSHRARAFMAKPPEHFMRIVSILRYFTALAETLPSDLLVPLLEPLLTPIYRCTSAFAVGSNWSTLPDVQTLDQMLQLTPAQRLEFLAQLAQTCMDTLTNKMKDAGTSSQLMQSLSKVRKAVERTRSERLQKKRVQTVVDPEAAAKAKRSKNRRKQAGKKRKMDDLIIAKKGGRGTKKARNLAPAE